MRLDDGRNIREIDLLHDDIDAVLPAQSVSLSGILCVGHNMRSVHAPKTENVDV
jgi:hypothetical protein